MFQLMRHDGLSRLIKLVSDLGIQCLNTPRQSRDFCPLRIPRYASLVRLGGRGQYTHAAWWRACRCNPSQRSWMLAAHTYRRASISSLWPPSFHRTVVNDSLVHSPNACMVLLIMLGNESYMVIVCLCLFSDF